MWMQIYKGLQRLGMLKRNESMDIGIIVVWISLLGYMVMVYKGKKVEKKERKWAYLLVITAFVFSILIMLNISLNNIIGFLNHTFGGISRMVVNI
jgi:membrane-associated HD superfamily phosphohydrolase